MLACSLGRVHTYNKRAGFCCPACLLLGRVRSFLVGSRFCPVVFCSLLEWAMEYIPLSSSGLLGIYLPR